ncbi:MAG: hypothetical protein PVH88_02550 [Ignavibacteria bacterium]|jgi:hypothetical protein
MWLNSEIKMFVLTYHQYLIVDRIASNLTYKQNILKVYYSDYAKPPYNKGCGEIIDAVDKIINNNNTPQSLLNEAMKTRNKLEAGCNVPITP